MKRLLLDIRENPGGPLDQAIKVSNRFLPKGDLIVYTRGRIPNSDQDYRAVENSDYTEHPDGHARQPAQRQRVGDRHRRAAGSRPRARRRRDDLGQGARAVHLPALGRRGPGADHRALLHAERTPDSAPMGRDLRRVPVVHDARPGSEQAACGLGFEVHACGWAARCTAAAASSRITGSTARSRDSTPASSAGGCIRRCSRTSRAGSIARAIRTFGTAGGRRHRATASPATSSSTMR